MGKPIAISLSPNTQTDDILLALRMLVSPGQLLEGENIRNLTQWFQTFFGVSHAFTFANGRAALTCVLQGMGVGEHDEVIVQSFTCVAVPNAVLALGAKPVYVDITSNYTMDPHDVARKITKKTKVIIVQHTFGIASDMKQILRLAKEHRIRIVEDCAHTIGGTYDNKLLGTFGHAAIFSFGRDKAFSSVSGGVAITNDAYIAQQISWMSTNMKHHKRIWVMRELLHPIFFAIILPLYDFFSIGKLLLVLLQKLCVLSLPVSQDEKKGVYKKNSIRKMPNALATLALHQLQKLSYYNTKRAKITLRYHKVFGGEVPLAGPLLGYPILIRQRDKALQELRKRHINLGTWYNNGIDPKGTDLQAIGYTPFAYPLTTHVQNNILNLPLYIGLREEEVDSIIQEVKAYV